MLYLLFTLEILGRFFFKIKSTSGDPIEKIFFFFLPFAEVAALLFYLSQNANETSLDIECLKISSTVPEISPPSI